MTEKKLSQNLEIPAETALFQGEVDGIVATFFENERPLAGLAGLLDWRLHGAISERLRAGAISGKAGECVYLPWTRHGVTRHVLLVGAGFSEAPGRRGKPDAEAWQTLKKNLPALGLKRIGVSRADFGNMTDSELHQQLKGVPLWIAP